MQRGGFADEVHASRAELDRWLSDTAAPRLAESPPVGTPSSAPVCDARATPADELAASSELTASAKHSRLKPVFGVRDVAWAAAVVVAAIGGTWLGGGSRADLPQARPVIRDESPDSLIVGDRRGQLVGRIAVDLNRNGEWDAGEQFTAEPGRACPNSRPVAGFVVRWEGSSRGSSAAINCNPEPFYHANLAPGRYRVTLALPPGWRPSSPTTADVEIQTSRDTHLWFTVVPRS